MHFYVLGKNGKKIGSRSFRYPVAVALFRVLFANSIIILTIMIGIRKFKVLANLEWQQPTKDRRVLNVVDIDVCI